MREKAEKKLTKKAEQLISSEKELQRLYGESEQARKSLLSILEDVTLKEEALKESESKLNSILTSIDDPVFVFDQDNRFIPPQHSPEEQLYTTPDEFIGKKPSEVMPSHLNKIFSDAFDKIKEGQVAEYDYRLKINGKTMWFSAKHSPRFIDGEFVGSVSVVRNITERKQAEGALRQMSNEQEVILDSMPAMIFYKDTGNRFLRVNKVLADTFGLPKEEIIGKAASELSPAEKDYWEDDQEVMKSGQPMYNIIEPVETPEGTLWFQTDKIPYKDSEGDTIGIIGFSIDITERRKAEEELRLFNEMAVDRELKMVELKKEMNSLLEELGREPRYKIPEQLNTGAGK